MWDRNERAHQLRQVILSLLGGHRPDSLIRDRDGVPFDLPVAARLFTVNLVIIHPGSSRHHVFPAAATAPVVFLRLAPDGNYDIGTNGTVGDGVSIPPQRTAPVGRALPGVVAGSLERGELGAGTGFGFGNGVGVLDAAGNLQFPAVGQRPSLTIGGPDFIHYLRGLDRRGSRLAIEVIAAAATPEPGTASAMPPVVRSPVVNRSRCRGIFCG